MEDNYRPNETERLALRASFVAQFINSNSRKGIKVSYSVRQLAYKILFVSEKTVYNDLKTGKEIRNGNKV